MGAAILSPSQAFMNDGYTGSDGAGGMQSSNTGTTQVISFNASRSSSIYGNSTTVQPPALTMRYIIKY